MRSRVERLQVVHRFAQADEPDRQSELAPQRRDRAAAGAAVELGHDDAGGRDRLRELPPCWIAF